MLFTVLNKLQGHGTPWYTKVRSILMKFEFKGSRANSSLFYRIQGQSHIYILIYVDDIIVTVNDDEKIDSFIQFLSKELSLKDLDKLHHFLGIEITETKEDLHLNQGQYIRDLLGKAKMSEVKPCPTPFITSSHFSKYDGDPAINGTLYRSIIGALQYITVTRLEISFSVNKVCQFMSNPLDSYWKAVKHILRYLVGTQDHGFYIRKSSHLHLTGFSDSNWATDPDGRRSTTGFCVYLGDSLVS